MSAYDLIDASTPEGRLKIAQYEHEHAEKITRGQQLYAKIKRSSKYCYQNDLAIADPKRWGGFPFPVFVEAGDPMSLSEILCVRHNMSARSMYAKQDEQEESGGGTAEHP